MKMPMPMETSKNEYEDMPRLNVDAEQLDGNYKLGDKVTIKATGIISSRDLEDDKPKRYTITVTEPMQCEGTPSGDEEDDSEMESEPENKGKKKSVDDFNNVPSKPYREKE